MHNPVIYTKQSEDEDVVQIVVNILEHTLPRFTRIVVRLR